MSDQQLKFRFITILCLTFSATLLVTGYLFAGWWQILLIFPVVLLFWKLSENRPGICTPSVLFGTYLILASLGIWMGHIPYLMVYGSILALAGWELQLFQRGWIGNPQPSDIELLNRYHLKSLSVVVVLSFLMTTVGLNFKLRLPFGVTLLLVLLVGFVFERVYFYFDQKLS